MTYCTAGDVREVLRMTGTTVDEVRIERAVDVASEAIDAYLDVLPTEIISPVPRSVEQAAINLAVEEYRRPGAAFGVLGFNDIDGVTRISSDHLLGVKSLLLPYKQRWGFA